jgi:hypothetical protein
MAPRDNPPAVRLDLMVKLQKLGFAKIAPLGMVLPKALQAYTEAFAAGPDHEENMDGDTWRVLPLQIPDGLGFALPIKHIGDVDIFADQGQVRFTLPSPMATAFGLAVRQTGWSYRGPNQAGATPRSHVWLMPRSGVAKLTIGPISIAVRSPV